MIVPGTWFSHLRLVVPHHYQAVPPSHWTITNLPPSRSTFNNIDHHRAVPADAEDIVLGAIIYPFGH